MTFFLESLIACAVFTLFVFLIYNDDSDIDRFITALKKLTDTFTK